MVRSQPREIVHETLSPKNPSQKRLRWVKWVKDGVGQDIGLEFKPQYHTKKKLNVEMVITTSELGSV
jgi:hypothetical protein